MLLSGTDSDTTSDEASPLPLTTLLQIEHCLPDIAQRYYHLILIVGPIGSGKTPLLKELCRRHSAPYINVNLMLSQSLLDLTTKQRPLRVHQLLQGIVAEHAADSIVLDNLELLFDPTLRQDPLVLLQELSRNRCIIAAWGGAYAGGTLTYAEPGHPEYQRYQDPDAIVIPVP
jgi:hypothetical protein